MILTILICFLCVKDTLANLGLLVDFRLEQIANVDASPTEIVGDGLGVLVLLTARWSHQKDSSYYRKNKLNKNKFLLTLSIWVCDLVNQEV